jgi:DNA-binding MarR family transcriptional regulator
MISHLDSSRHTAWRLFLTTHAVLIGAIEQELARADLPPLAWYDVLFALSETTAQKLRMHELATAMLLDRSNLTRLVDRMEAAGLVCRKTCPTDRRGAYAAITEAGLAKQQEMSPVYQQAIAKYFASHLSDTEVEVLLKALERMHAMAPVLEKV